MRQQSDKHKEVTSGGSSMPYTRQSKAEVVTSSLDDKQEKLLKNCK